LSISTSSANTKFYKCIITEACGSLTTTSNTAEIEIASSTTVSASISSTSSAICAGTNKTFTATALNEGTSPVYTWYKNGSVVSGQTSATYSTTGLSNGEAVYATVTSNKACAIGSPASSNTISTTVNALPSINTTTGSSSLNVGSSILLANTTSNGTWSSAAPGIASVASGTVTGISEGNVNILYSVTDNQTPACTNTATKAITVYAQSPSGLSYITPNVYIKGTAITALNPTISGGAVTGYTITPSLPSGLVINSSTGIISGTPTVNSPATNYTVTATNSGGSVSALVNLSVNEPAPSGLSYTTPNVYIKGTAITALNPTISGGAVTGYTITPSLPSGLVINNSTGIISGTPTVNSAATNYTVTASNSGGSVSAVLNITVKLDQPQGSISSVDYLLLKSDTVSLKLNVFDGTSPFSVILTNDQNNSKDTIVNLVDGAILKLKPLSKTTIFKLFKLIDANQSERASGFSKDTSIIRIAIPNLAMTLKAELPVKLPDNSFRTKLLLKLKNAGELGLKNVQVNANLSQVFPTYLNYVLDSIKLVSGNVRLNSNYTGKGTATSSSNSKANNQSSSIKSNASLDPNYLFDNGVNLAVSDEAEVQYFMSIAATPNNITLKLQFETEGQAAITKNDGSISQEVSKAVSDNGINITAHPNITSIGTPVPTFLPLYPVEKIGASLSASNATPVAGGYTFDFVAKVKNYSNLNLDTVALINELSKTFTSPDTAYIINTPVVTGGVKFNTSFNGYSNTLLIDSTAKLAVGDSATIAYTLKVITDKINYTWLNSVNASGHSTLDYDFVKDISVEGSIPDPNADGDPLEQTETRFSVSYIRPDAPTVNNAIYTFNTNYPTTIGGLVKTYPLNSIPVWCDPATAICNPTAPTTPLAIGKYVFYLKSYDSTTRLYSVNYVNDTVTIKPPVPKVIDSTYIIGLNGNPSNVSVQVNALSGSSVVYYSNGIKLSAIPQLGNVSGQYNYSASQIVNQVESDTVGFKVNMLNLNSVIHLQKLAGQAVLQSNSTFNIPFTFIVTNLLNKKLENIVITDNLLNSIYTPSTFNVINVSSSGGIIANKLFNGSTDIALTTIQSTLNPLSIDTVRLSLNILPYGFSGQLNNTAVINAKTPYGSISMNSSSSVLAGELSKNPTKYTIPELLINIPEGFSPNRDGVNDKFIIIKPFGTDLELEVFNRWGNVVYYNANYNNDWDGRGTNNFLGQDLMDGGYYYTLRAKDSKGNIQIFKGFVLIQR
jgi:gliding motility-associated-like protein